MWPFQVALCDHTFVPSTVSRLFTDPLSVNPDDTVIDLGCGTGAVSLELAADANRVIGRDVSERMLAIARENAAERSIDNVTFDIGRFREPNVESADVVVTNLAIHHLDDDAKREAIEAIASLGPRRVVIGAAMFFEDRHPEEPEYDPAVVYPATVGDMVRWVTDAGYPVTVVEKCNPYTGVIVAEESVG